MHSSRSCPPQFANRGRKPRSRSAGGSGASVSGPLCLTRPSSVSQVRLSPSNSGVAALERGDDAQGLGVVVEAAVGREARVERPLAGMAERRMAEVVRQRQRFRQILVEAERAGQRAGDLGDLQRVGQPRAVMVALVEDEHLGLVASRRKAVEWMMRSQSRRKSLRVGLGGSGCSRPRLGPDRRHRARAGGRRNRHARAIRLTAWS